MRYPVIVSRVQVAERNVRAVSEEDAVKQVQDELDRPHGFFGAWTTTSTNLDVTEVTSGLHQSPPPPGEEDKLHSSIKDSAKHLGVSYGALYELVNTAEIQHVSIGRRKYISRDHLRAFIESHTRLGWHGREPL